MTFLMLGSTNNDSSIAEAVDSMRTCLVLSFSLTMFSKVSLRSANSATACRLLLLTSPMSSAVKILSSFSSLLVLIISLFMSSALSG